MKYKPEDYLQCNFYTGEDSADIDCHSEKVVKCRKPHLCACGCGTEIRPGDHALLETGFLDGKPVSSYTACSCIDRWLEESGQVGFDEQMPEEDDDGNKTVSG